MRRCQRECGPRQIRRLGSQEVERLEVAVNDARRVKEVHSLGGLQSEPHLERQRDLRDQLVVEEIVKE